MALAPGTRLGPYELTEQIGIGGMGEVYRATDRNLGRDVAIKVLPEAFAQDAERLARFEREARTLASLNHPNIAIIHGLEQDDGVRALVMELVEGPTIADLIARPAGPSGPAGLPIDEALAIAKQIAEALEAAHEQGIIHRDLKPANVKVRDDGTVKVLDFGLAKMIGPPATYAADAATAPKEGGPYVPDVGAGFSRPTASMSPTITTPAMTQLGMILGTAAYMAPEQARGRAVDKRSDIWAFGCVLFEMLTGQKAFDGEDVTDTIAAVVRAEPKWEALPADVPAHIRLLLRRCLEKDRKKRIGDIAGALFVMRDAEALSAAPVSVTASTPRPASLWRQIGWYALAMIAASLVTVAAVKLLTRTDAPRVSRLELTTTGEAVLSEVPTRRVALTPDGSRLVYVGGAIVGRPGLFVRKMDDLDAVRLVADGDRPFVSPDGQWVGFMDPPILKKVAITGGPSIDIAKVDGGFRGGTWGTDGKIIFASNSPETGLLRVSSDGGEIEVLTRPEKAKGEPDHIWPQLLPGEHAVLFTISAADGGLATSANSQIAVLDLRSPTPALKILIRGGSDARYVPTGHLVYFADGSLRAVRFDPDRMEVIGSAIRVLGSLATVVGNSGDFDVAQNGTVVYAPQEEGASLARTLTWVDRQGKEEAIPADPRRYLFPRISPEGTRVALDVREGDNDIWVWDLARRTFVRVTRDPGQDRAPVWSADGQFIFYSGQVDGVASVYRQRADGNGTPERLTKPEAPQFPVSLSPQGTHLMLDQGTRGPADHDLMMLALSANAAGASIREAEDVVKTSAGEGNGSVSPNGRWLAYQSDQSGDWEIYVQPFADKNGARLTVSTNGGTQPRWSSDGRELFYVSPRSEMMRVPVGTGAVLSPGTPEVLFDARPYFLGSVLNSPYFMYDVATDGRFLMVKPVAGSKTRDTTANLVVIQNWFEELKRLVP